MISPISLLHLHHSLAQHPSYIQLFPGWGLGGGVRTAPFSSLSSPLQSSGYTPRVRSWESGEGESAVHMG